MTHPGLVHDGFLANWRDRPAAIALETAGRKITYATLGEHAAAIAATLARHRQGNDPGITGLIGDKSESTYAALLAVLMSGEAYLPLNAGQPLVRLADMVNRVGCTTLIVARSRLELVRQLLPLLHIEPVIVVPEQSGEKSTEPPARTVFALEPAANWLAPACDPARTAYLMFTSGSTGQPKGVVVSHHSVRHFLDAIAERYRFTALDRFSQWFDLDFDLSVFDLFAAWDAGATVCVPDPDHSLAPARFVRDTEITVWFSVPSIGRMMLRRRQLHPGRLTSLRLALFCGEALTRDLVEAWAVAAPAAVIENLYGPTELTLACTAYRWGSDMAMEAAAGGGVPIGVPLPGMEALVVDEALHERVDGEIGELLVGGPQTADGYWQDEARTAAAFLSRPDRPERFYRTGDLASRHAPDGVLLFHGRVDHQVQVRGVRVELAEVEAAIRLCCDANAAVVLPWPFESAHVDSLFAVLESETLIDSAVLQRRLRDHLPDLMVPRRFVTWRELPLNRNGKIDRPRILAKLLDPGGTSLGAP